MGECRAATNVRTFEYYLFEIFTNVDVHWSVFGAHICIAERSFVRDFRGGCPARMALLMKSCVDACQCHVPEIRGEFLLTSTYSGRG